MNGSKTGEDPCHSGGFFLLRYGGISFRLLPVSITFRFWAPRKIAPSSPGKICWPGQFLSRTNFLMVRQHPTEGVAQFFVVPFCLAAFALSSFCALNFVGVPSLAQESAKPKCSRFHIGEDGILRMKIKGEKVGIYKSTEEFTNGEVGIKIDCDNSWEKEFDTVLAAAYVGPQAVKQAILLGLDVNVKDGDGQTPLHHLMFGKNVEPVKALLENGAGLELKNEFGQTPLHYAVSGADNAEIIRFLISSGANIETRDTNGETPLMETVYSPSVKTKILIDAGANVNAQDNHGETALHKAAFSAEVYIMEFLIEAGADATILTNYDETVMDSFLDGQKSKLKRVIELLK